MCVCVRERERERGREAYIIENRLDFSVCVRVNETERQRSLYFLVLDCGVAGYCVWYLRKCKMEKKIKEIQDLLKKSFSLFLFFQLMF